MLQLVLLQCFAIVLTSLVLLIVFGQHAAVSLMLGGGACILPTALFAFRLWLDAKKPQGANPATFLLGEFVKVGLTVLLLFLSIKFYSGMVWPAFIGGLVIALKSYLFLLIKR
ncbi:ATP synthase subunit I [Ampullimonas aquatilis]|uniref:ATP synthase subunit I n=1 Tax=Ampullimonas aquatilis TaxID=1341549 RepID=UPI003C732710